ncbi:MAG: 4-hydroxybenzoate octaprenyltransferase [Gammaproteobacteria bacterium]
MKTTSAASSTSVSKELLYQIWLYVRLMRFDQPIGIWLLLWPTLWGLWISAEGHPDPAIFTIFVFGVVVMRAAGCVFNDYADRNIDSQVSRTSSRPLTSGQITPTEALVLFAALALIALGLVLMLNKLTQVTAIAAALLTVIYPYTKRFFSTPQFVLGAAFGWSIPMAFAAQTNALPRLAWLMWLAVVVWAVVYDTMYAMADRDDDIRAGVRSTAILFGQADIYIISLLQALLLIALLLVGNDAGLGFWYRLSLGFAAVFMVYEFFLIRNRSPEMCLRAFRNNHYIGATVFCGIVLHYTFVVPAVEQIPQ